MDFPKDEWGPGEEVIYLMGSEWQCIVRTVSLLLPPFNDISWEAPVRFVLQGNLPFGLLGYEGFLNRWAVSFNAYAGYTVVETMESFAERIPVDPWEAFQKDWDGWDRPGQF